MGWRFRKRATLFPGVRVNLSSRGISTTFGIRGASINVGPNGTYLNTGIPGTGIYNRTRLDGKPNLENLSPQDQLSDSPRYFFPDNLQHIKDQDNVTITSDGLKGAKETLLAAFQEREKLKREIG